MFGNVQGRRSTESDASTLHNSSLTMVAVSCARCVVGKDVWTTVWISFSPNPCFLSVSFCSNRMGVVRHALRHKFTFHGLPLDICQRLPVTGKHLFESVNFGIWFPVSTTERLHPFLFFFPPSKFFKSVLGSFVFNPFRRSGHVN